MLNSHPAAITTHYDHSQFIAAVQEYFDYVYNRRFILPEKSTLKAYSNKKFNFDSHIVSPSSGKVLSPLGCAIEMENTYIVRFLLEQGADPLKPVSPTDTKTPLQMIVEMIKSDFYLSYRNNRFLREIYQSIFAHVKASHKEFSKFLEDSIGLGFVNLHSLILKKINTARNQNKKILILLGETHTSTLEVILNAMIIEIAVRFDVSNLMIEQSKKYQLLLKDIFHQQSYDDPYLMDELWSPGIGNHLYGYRLGMKMIPMDLQRDNQHSNWNASPEGSKEREHIMIHQILRYKTMPAFCTVGLAHMRRIIEHPQIQDSFEVIAINGFSEPNTKEDFAFAYSSNVLQASELFSPDFIRQADTLLAPIDGLNIVAEAAKKDQLRTDVSLSSTKETEPAQVTSQKNKKKYTHS